MRSRKPFAQNQKDGRSKNKHKEENFVAHDRTDQRHFLLAGRQPLRFAKFVQSGQGKLCGDQPQNNRGSGKKAMQRDFQRAFEEK